MGFFCKGSAYGQWMLAMQATQEAKDDSPRMAKVQASSTPCSSWDKQLDLGFSLSSSGRNHLGYTIGCVGTLGPRWTVILQAHGPLRTIHATRRVPADRGTVFSLPGGHNGQFRGYAGIPVQGWHEWGRANLHCDPTVRETWEVHRMRDPKINTRSQNPF